MSVKADIAGPYVDLCKTDGDHNCLMNAYAKYLNTVKICPAPVSTGQCWHTTDPTGMHDTVLGDDAGLVLADGSYIEFDWDGGDCNACAKMVVDVNGEKPPNKSGKDVMGLWLMPNGLKPVGFSDNENADGDTCAAGGSIGCSAEVLYK